MIPLCDEYKNIFFIKGRENGHMPYSHSLLLGDFLIDTGISGKHIRFLKKNVEINNIILSHWHQDHIMGNRFFIDKKKFAHYEDKYIIENFNENYMLYYGITDPVTKRFSKDAMEAFRICDVKIDVCFSDGDIIKIGEDLKLKVIHTPGHSKGHCCFLELNSKILFLADIDLSTFGPWYSGLDSDLLEFENSIRKLKKLDFNIAISSHKGIIGDKNEVLQQLEKYQNIIALRDHKILEYFSEKCPITICDLTRKNIIYKRYSELDGGYSISVDKNMIEKHLDKFLKKGIIRFEEGYILQ